MLHTATLTYTVLCPQGLYVKYLLNIFTGDLILSISEVCTLTVLMTNTGYYNVQLKKAR